MNTPRSDEQLTVEAYLAIGDVPWQPCLLCLLRYPVNTMRPTTPADAIEPGLICRHCDME